MEIRYLNTDLDLAGPDDLGPLAAALVARGVRSLRVSRCDDGLWHATFETDQTYEGPEANIAGMLAAVESLSGPLKDSWSSCTLRELNIGYDCGNKPWAFNQGLTNATLRRSAAAGLTLRITLYPPVPPRKRSRAKA